MTTNYKIADALEQLAATLRSGDEVALPKLYVNFGCCWEKDEFLRIAALFPRPFEKKFTDTELEIKNATDELYIRASINRNKVCRLVRPAQYECEPLLSAEEEAQISA